MKGRDIKQFWLDTYQELSIKAEIARDSQSVSFGLMEVYDELTESERTCVHEILSEWIVSTDSRLRYDAAFLASQREIVALKPAVETALSRARNSPNPERKYEADNLQRILSELSDM